MNTRADGVFQSADEARQGLCYLYRQCGYRHYKMSKFEEYDFYAKNKNFLVSNNIITFTDPDGRLMALKPDITLSIVKNARWQKGGAEKVYYTESVYRAEKDGGEFREITQTGLECVGDLSLYDTAEVLLLAVQSLEKISKDSLQTLSHLGFLDGLKDEASPDEQTRSEVLRAISEKNMPALRALCEKKALSAENGSRLMTLAGLCGSFPEAEPILQNLNINEKTNDALSTLHKLYDALRAVGAAEKLRVDFSLLNDMRYYNGIVFRGYINGVPQGVLAGGSYDRLLSEMGKEPANAIGFAIYLDLLERLFPGEKDDEPVLLQYDSHLSIGEVLKEAQALREKGMRVRVQNTDEDGATRCIRLTKEGISDANA